jgi:N-methylhydantoinase A/oxoprolinase/acetone carboxylase beta subunit
MAYGGQAPTPTDALFVLGKVSNGDEESSRRGIEPIAKALGLSIEEAAAHIFDHACHRILDAAAHMIADINSKPVYTVQELLEGYQIRPKEILILGGPAPYFAFRFAALTDFDVRVVPQWQVANAIGAALARNTCQVTLFCDTEQGIAVAPEENFSRSVGRDYGKKEAVALAFDLLRRKCVGECDTECDLEMEVIEDAEFNMVRDFYTTGRSIRVKVQVKPGLIPEYRQIAEKLFNSCPLPGYS